MRAAIPISMIVALLLAAAPAVSATRPLDVWTAVIQPDVPERTDFFLQVKNAIDWQRPATLPRDPPPVLRHVLQVYAALVAAAYLARRLPATRRTAQAADAAEARSRTR